VLKADNRRSQSDWIRWEAYSWPTSLHALSGCLTQGTSVEDARKNPVDAIEVWLMSGLRSGEDPPVLNGCSLAITAELRKRADGQCQPRSDA
jgi:predicted RNase H-like HicB family nuclease